MLTDREAWHTAGHGVAKSDGTELRGKLLYSTGSSAWYSVMTQKGRMVSREVQRERTHVYI